MQSVRATKFTERHYSEHQTKTNLESLLSIMVIPEIELGSTYVAPIMTTVGPPKSLSIKTVTRTLTSGETVTCLTIEKI